MSTKFINFEVNTIFRSQKLIVGYKRCTPRLHDFNATITFRYLIYKTIKSGNTLEYGSFVNE